jgi:hypothetical protein
VKRLTVFCFAFAMFVTNAALAQTNRGETTVFFANGVLTTYADAIFELTDLADAVLSVNPETTIPTESLNFQLSFNHSGNLMLDLYESSRQLLNDSVSDFMRFVGRFDAAPNSFQERANHIAKTIDSAAFVISADLQEHVRDYRAEITSGNKVVVVAHSQGNFYANEAHKTLYGGLDNQPKLMTKSFGIVSVATPANSVEGNGPYTTKIGDPVILAVIAATRELNLPQPLTPNTIGVGHSFDGYLEGTFSRPKILNDIINVILALQSPPVVSRPTYTFSIDTFRVVKNGVLFFQDTFGDGFPPANAPSFVTGTSASYSVIGTFGPERNGKLTIDSSGAGIVPPISGGTDFLFHRARLQTNTDSNNLTEGLKVDDTFSVTGAFDLIVPEGIVEGYGISMSDRTSTNDGNDDLRLLVRQVSGSLPRISFLRADPSSDLVTFLASVLLEPNHSQIVLTLTRATTSNNAIRASFAYIDGGVQGSTTILPVTANIFRSENFTRALFMAESRLPE